MSDAPASERIATVLGDAYGMRAFRVGDAPRGFVAETFVADVADGRRVFVKWLPAWVDAERAAAMHVGLAIAARLNELGIAAAPPLRTTDGALWTALDGRTLAVFPFIEGARGAVLDQRMGPAALNHGFDPLIALLAEIHAATPALDSAPPREAFALPFAADFERAWRATFETPVASDSHGAMQTLLAPHKAQIEVDWAGLRRMAAACRAAAWTPVITHGDLAGDNVIVGADGRLWAIDWDYPLLAPVERDAWFFTCNTEAEAAFLEAYRRAQPGYAVDPLVRRFYLFQRFFEDIYGYIDIVLGNERPERKAWSVAELEKTCFQWLWPPMRSL